MNTLEWIPGVDLKTCNAAYKRTGIKPVSQSYVETSDDTWQFVVRERNDSQKENSPHVCAVSPAVSTSCSHQLANWAQAHELHKNEQRPEYSAQK